MGRTFIIEDINDYRKKLDIAYQKWRKNNFTESWIKNFENYYDPDSDLWDFIKLLRARKELSEEEYKKVEEETFKMFEETDKIMSDALEVFKAEQEALKKAGIKEGKVTYTCPLCGGNATVVIYKHGNKYHKMGKCLDCGFSHT